MVSVRGSTRGAERFVNVACGRQYLKYAITGPAVWPVGRVTLPFHSRPQNLFKWLYRVDVMRWSSEMPD